MAAAARRAVHQRTGLTCSAGIASSKLFAKLVGRARVRVRLRASVRVRIRIASSKLFAKLVCRAAQA